MNSTILRTATLADELIDRRTFQGGATRFVGNFGQARRIACVRAARLCHLEQGIGVERLADIGFDLEVGERQQLDRLLQLRRHHQRLALPQVKARPHRHGSGPRAWRHHSVNPSPR